MVRTKRLRIVHSRHLLTCALAGLALTTSAFAASAKAPRRGLEPHIGPYPGSDLERLESRPEAEKAIYLDISEIMNGDTPTNMPKEHMWRMWQCVASSLSMFEINVTTDPAAYARAGVVNSAVLRFVDQDGRSHGPIDSFGTTMASTIYNSAHGPEILGIIVAQLTAQHFGLRGDGGPDSVNTSYNWSPLLLALPEAAEVEVDSLFQWSKGECSGCTNDQDDLAIIHNYAEFRADDYPEPVALVVDSSGSVSAKDNRGQIGVDDEGDAFEFEIGVDGGEVELFINRTESPCAGMLDVHAELFDADGKLLENRKPWGTEVGTDRSLARPRPIYVGGSGRG